MQKETIEKELKPGLVTHHRDGHGKLIAVMSYRLHIRSGAKYFEYPKLSGNLWYEKGGFFTEPAGRIDIKGEIDVKAEHIAYIAPKTGSEHIVEENEVLKRKTETLQKELDAILKEQTAKLANETRAKEMVVAAEAKAKAETKKETKT